MKTKKTITKELVKRYQKARKKKKKILDEFVSLSCYNRSYASWLLRNFGKRPLPFFLRIGSLDLGRKGI